MKIFFRRKSLSIVFEIRAYKTGIFGEKRSASLPELQFPYQVEHMEKKMFFFQKNTFTFSLETWANFVCTFRRKLSSWLRKLYATSLAGSSKLFFETLFTFTTFSDVVYRFSAWLYKLHSTSPEKMRKKLFFQQRVSLICLSWVCKKIVWLLRKTIGMAFKTAFMQNDQMNCWRKIVSLQKKIVKVLGF